MTKILESVGLAFDDVLLVPKKSTIRSRFGGEIDLSVEVLPNIKIKYPIISADMDCVSEYKLCNEMNKLGGLGIIHRFLTTEKHIEQLKQVLPPRIVCIGVIESEFKRLERILKEVNIDAILINIAHGHSTVMLEQIEKIKKSFNLPIMAGNVATADGVEELLDAGVQSIRVSVGSGSICATRIQTGCGVPLITSLINGKQVLEKWWNENKNSKTFKPTLIADGGARNSGDCVKALAAGADIIMSGSLFAGTEEACAELVKTKQGLFKAYRGSASFSAQKSWKGHATSVEGVSTMVPYKGPVKDVFEEIIAGILSGMSYQNARTLKELQDGAVFIRQTSAGYRESIPHILLKGEQS